MKTNHPRYIVVSVILVISLLNLYLIYSLKEKEKMIGSLNRKINTITVENQELLSEVQKVVNENGLDYNLISKYIDLESIDKESLLVFIPPNSCASCIERLFVQIGSKEKLKHTSHLLIQNRNSFTINTWKNLVNSSNIIVTTSIPEVFLSRNRALIIWMNKEFQQLKFIWENPTIPTMTDNFLSEVESS